MTRRKRERGQVLVLAVLMLGALFGFGAIALDGGNIYADRRSAQAAADTASMAGALAVMRGYGVNQVKRVAELRAERNGYPIVAGKTSVTVNWPPASPHPYAGNWNYIQVIITNRLDTILAHLFYGGAFRHTVEATAHAARNETLAPGYAVYADNPTACPGIEFAGSLQADVSGGGSILSNSSACNCGAGDNLGAGYGHGGGTATVVDPTGRAGIFTVGCWAEGTFNYSLPGGGVPSDYAGQEYVDPPPLPDCSTLPNHTTDVPSDKSYNTSETLFPGRYDSIAAGANATVTLSPGIYCLEGSGTGGGGEALSIGATANIYGLDVMIYLTDTAGGIKMLGDGIV
ncbi:MAG: pilus assembly protein TadG-related protein, partial [Anaerolineales bacterium]